LKNSIGITKADGVDANIFFFGNGCGSSWIDESRVVHTISEENDYLAFGFGGGEAVDGSGYTHPYSGTIVGGVECYLVNESEYHLTIKGEGCEGVGIRSKKYNPNAILGLFFYIVFDDLFGRIEAVVIDDIACGIFVDELVVEAFFDEERGNLINKEHSFRDINDENNINTVEIVLCEGLATYGASKGKDTHSDANDDEGIEDGVIPLNPEW